MENLELDKIGTLANQYDFEGAFQEVHELIKNIEKGSEDEQLSLHLNTRGLMHLQLGRYDDALEDCMKARTLNSNLDQTNLKLARLFSNHFESVFKNEMTKLTKGVDVKACATIATAYYDSGFYSHAAGYFRVALHKAKGQVKASLLNDLSACYLGSGFIIEAYKAAAKAVKINSAIDKTNFRIAESQLKKFGLDPNDFGKRLKVEKLSEAKHELEEEDISYLNKDSESLLESITSSITNIRNGKSSVEKNEHNLLLAGYLSHRAFCYLNLGKIDEAIEDCHEARKVDPLLDHSNLRLAQFFKEQYDELLKPLFEKLEKEISADTYNEIGIVYHNNGFYSNAAYYFQLAANISFELVKAESYNNLAGAYYEEGLIIDSLIASFKAVRFNPEINKVNYNLARMKLKAMGFTDSIVKKYTIEH